MDLQVVCTLALAWQVFAQAPVVAAANRDEATDRPSEPPMVRRDGDGGTESPVVVAPRDAEAGGTWVGLNDEGVYVTITNRWLADSPLAERSRGLLVGDCLSEASAESAVRLVERELNRRTYDGFNLILADDVAAFVLSWDGDLTITRLDPGVHVVSNVGGLLNGRDVFSVPEHRADAGERQVENVRRLAARLTPEPGERVGGEVGVGHEEAVVDSEEAVGLSGEPVAGGEAVSPGWLDRAAAALGDHDSGVCVHGDGFGTRSSTLVRSGPDPLFAYADGPPCETAFERVPLPSEWW